jgi:hypothetical protein
MAGLLFPVAEFAKIPIVGPARGVVREEDDIRFFTDPTPAHSRRRRAEPVLSAPQKPLIFIATTRLKGESQIIPKGRI